MVCTVQYFSSIFALKITKESPQIVDYIAILLSNLLTANFVYMQCRFLVM